MKRHAFALLLLIAAGIAQAGSAMIPRREPEPARLEAARRFVAALPVAEGVSLRPDRAEMMRAEFSYLMANEAQQQLGARDLERIMPAFQTGIYSRVEAALPGVLPAALEDIARAYALEMQAADLDAAGRFFATTEGRAFAARTVITDRIIFETLKMHLARAIVPELGTILAAARVRQAEHERAEAEHDVLRLRVNAASRRRN